jgi:hypothetical protein
VRAFYFGTYREPGHYLRDQDWRHVWPENTHQGVDKIVWGPLPWRDIDGGLQPRGPDGTALLHHKDGWTALAFPNNSDDNRGSNSAFFFDAVLDFDEAVEAARQHFPHVVERFPFEVRLMPVPSNGEGTA